MSEIPLRANDELRFLLNEPQQFTNETFEICSCWISINVNPAGSLDVKSFCEQLQVMTGKSPSMVILLHP